MARSPIPVRVDNRVRLPILPEDTFSFAYQRLKQAFTHENPSGKDDGFQFYRTFEETETEFSVPRGGMSEVREIFSQEGIDYGVKDARCRGDRKYLDNDWGGKPFPKLDLKPRDWQEDAVEKIFHRENCILRAPTGSGKSTAALYLILKMNVPVLVSVPTVNLVEQWVELLMERLGLEKKDIGQIGDGKKKTAPITIATQDSLAQGIREEWNKAFGAFIFDEVQRAAAPTIFKAVDPWSARYRIGMSANETRHDKKEFLIYDLFGDPAADIKEEDVLASEDIVEVEIRLVPTEMKAEWYKQATMSNNVFYIRNAHKKLLQLMWNDSDRNDLIYNLVEEEVKEGNQVMVLSLRREHCLMMDRHLVSSRIKSGVMLGGRESKAQFQKTKEGIRDRKTKVIVGTINAIGTGQDFPSVSTGIVTMPIHNNRQQMQQVKGRFCRACEEIGKTKGVLYYIWDRKIFGKKPLVNFSKWFKKVSVWHEGKWIEGKEFLESMENVGPRRPASGPIRLDDMMGDQDE